MKNQTIWLIFIIFAYDPTCMQKKKKKEQKVKHISNYVLILINPKI